MMYPFEGYWGSYHIFGFIFMILFWALLIWALVYLFQSASKKDHKDPNQDKKPMEILKDRYAKGEIDKKEFDEKKKDLEA